jgi:hypothetical protein
LRGDLVADRTRDDALVAWLASRHIKMELGRFEKDFTDVLREISPSNRQTQSNDIRELAFAALGSGGQ